MRKEEGKRTGRDQRAEKEKGKKGKEVVNADLKISEPWWWTKGG